jgi:hypothetical protein
MGKMQEKYEKDNSVPTLTASRQFEEVYEQAWNDHAALTALFASWHWSVLYGLLIAGRQGARRLIAMANVPLCGVICWQPL